MKELTNERLINDLVNELCMTNWSRVREKERPTHAHAQKTQTPLDSLKGGKHLGSPLPTSRLNTSSLLLLPLLHCSCYRMINTAILTSTPAQECGSAGVTCQLKIHLPCTFRFRVLRCNNTKLELLDLLFCSTSSSFSLSTVCYHYIDKF